MKKTTSKEDVPYFFLVNDKYAIGTPRGMAPSDKTMDVPFHDLAKNYDLQNKLNLMSAVLIRPLVLPPLAYPLEGRELINGVATFLAAFSDDPKEETKRRDYLIGNGLVRIVANDPTLREEIRATLTVN